MRCRILLFLAMAGLSGCSSTTASARSHAVGWELVWRDEFDGSALDRNKWKPEISCWGGGNEERQCYTDRPDNIRGLPDQIAHLKSPGAMKRKKPNP
jgi:beta-glucanase (GH16 family)